MEKHQSLRRGSSERERERDALEEVHLEGGADDALEVAGLEAFCPVADVEGEALAHVVVHAAEGHVLVGERALWPGATVGREGALVAAGRPRGWATALMVLREVLVGCRDGEGERGPAGGRSRARGGGADRWWWRRVERHGARRGRADAGRER